MNKLKSLNPIAKTALAAFIFFLIWQVLLIVRYRGMYSFDEMFHISSSDAYFHSISEYDRAPYLNWTVRFLASVFGRHYYTYKLIPFVLSLISIGSLLYLSSKLFQHTYNIILFTLLCAGHQVLIFNHLYVRMYIWDESVIALLAVIMYKLSQIGSIYKKIGLHILYLALSAFLYVMQTREETSLSVLYVGIGALCLNYLGRYLITWLKKKKLLIPCLCLLIPLIICTEYILLLLRMQEIRPNTPPFFKSFSSIWLLLADHSPITTNIYSPVFVSYFICNNLLLLVGIIGYGYLLLKNKYEENNMTGIYSLALLPFIAYNMLYFDRFLFRTYAAFLPVLIFIVLLWMDSFQDTRRYRCIALAAVLITILFSQPGMKQNPFTDPIRDLVYFAKYPNLTWETVFNEYGALISQAQQDIDEGRKCISIWRGTAQQYAFELDGDYPISLTNDVNVPYGYTAEDVEQLLSYLSETEDSYVLLVGFHVNSFLDELVPGITDSLCETYPYKHYGDNDAYLFYIN